ncbi:MAG: hypothetical protein A3K19_26195 [Lentisphaerae bacterium RIFOXYB12_FULL_65_16]|nr:MAG: hypothetical protein A3K18_29660 [Lentisphaerae bacterium RIFOXYA12_64_32]OGV87766.1 MAG: hypothetical protein A3K19_26195 [Lentisphaerae bacterium RIFOXYB12_FULL_65_16]
MPNERPNILFYCTDQQRADLLGCMGHPGIRTPNIDALAQRGVVLSNLYVQGTVCMPSRASIMTGRYPCVHGVTDNGYNLPEHERTFAHTFRDAGYHTLAVGRTHVSCSRRSQPHPVLPQNYHGFTECHHTQCYWEGLDPHGDYLNWIRTEHPEWYNEAATPTPVDRLDAHCASWSKLPPELTMNAWVTDRSLAVIRNHREKRAGQPFLLWAGTWDPHSRFLVPAPWDRMYPPESIPLPVRREGELDDLPPHYRKNAHTAWPRCPGVPFDEVIRNTLSIYWGTISFIDDQFGRLLRGLDDMGCLDNTIIVFTSDHGDQCGDHWVWHKGPYWFDGALRIPGVIAAPAGMLKHGLRADALVETVDFYPTLCEMAGIAAPPQVQGRSCLGLLEGRTCEHRTDAYTEYQAHVGCTEQMFSLRDERYRIVVYRDRPYGELYDYQTDPDSLHNRWAHPDYREVRERLTARLTNRLMANLERPDTREDWW